MDDDDDVDVREQIFHNTVRENIIFLLLFLLLFVSSYVIIGQFRRCNIDDYFLSDNEGVKVYNISLLLCTFSLAIAVGAVLLLPVSIVSNEVLLLYSDSYYIKWLNHSLVQGLWNHIFLFSNVSLFAFVPFAYFLTESEGLPGYHTGIKGRVYETIILLTILFGFLFGIAYILSSFFNHPDRTFGIFSLLTFWDYLPFLYSCISFFGVSMLLLCTPLGFAHLFTVVGTLLVRPQFLKNLEDEYLMAHLEKLSIQRRLENCSGCDMFSCILPSLICVTESSCNEPDRILKLRNGELHYDLLERLNRVQETLSSLDAQRRLSFLPRNIMYPAAMAALLGLTIIAVFIVLTNTVELLIGFKALPISSRQFTLGISSLSTLGPFGAILEVILILYLIVTSIIGLYTIPPIKKIRPRLKQTPFLHVVANCVLLLVLSSALPLLSRILGITNFDLIGDFGQIEWLGNFYVVLSYNVLFIVTTTVCLMGPATKSFCEEIYSRIKYLHLMIFRRHTSNHPHRQKKD